MLGRVRRERAGSPVAGALTRYWLDAALLASFVVLTIALQRGALLGLDVAVRDWTDSHRPPVLFWTARILNFLGQGGTLASLCLILAAVLAWRRHTVRPLLPVGVAFALTYLTLAPLKLITDRAAPHLPADVPDRERFHSGGMEYPSGHVVNAIVWYGVLALLASSMLTPRAYRALRVLPPAVVSVVTTYTGYHWLTDTIAGLALGVLLDRVMHRIDWNGVPLGPLARLGWAGPSGFSDTASRHAARRAPADPHRERPDRRAARVRSRPDR